MQIFILVLTMIVALLLIGAVLLQNSKGSGLTGAFGSMGAAQTLGVRRTADFLSRATGYLAATFMVLCVIAEFVGSSASKVDESRESVIQKNAPVQTPLAPPALPNTPAPTQPEGTPPAQPEGTKPEKPAEK